MEKMLEGKVCLVTGAGRGIGKAAALLFAKEGGKVVLNDVDRAEVEETMEEIRRSGGAALSVPGDITAEGVPEKMVRAAVDAFGPGIDVIANVAGYTWDGMIHKMDDRQWDAILKVHLTAPFRIIRAAAPYIREKAKAENETGRRVMRKIINVSSVSGTDGTAGQANYSSAKAGIIGLTKSLAREWGPLNVNVNCVAFGWIETRLTGAKENSEFIEREGRKIALGIPGRRQEGLRSLIPLGRPGTAEEAARVILFFASPLSDYVSGQILKVAGGLH
jgi:3-oxoacyl-[acyl-carrier protein] reductase